MGMSEEIKAIKGNEAAMVFCESMAERLNLYGMDEWLANEACWLSAKLAEEDVSVSSTAVLAVIKQIAAGE